MKCRFLFLISLAMLLSGFSSLTAQDRYQLFWEVDSLIDAINYELALEKVEGLIDSDSAQFKGVGYQLKGVIFNYQKRDDLAIKMFDEAEKYMPLYAELYASKARFYFERYEMDSALVNYEEAISLLNNSHSDVYKGNLIMDAALPLKYMEKNELALEVLDMSLKFRTDNWLTYFHKADIFYFQLEMDSAMWYVNLAEQQEGGRNASIDFIKAGVYHWTGQLDRALTLAKSIEGKMDDPYRLQFLLGEIYRYQGAYELAITHFSQALELFPESPPALNNIAFVNMALERYDVAIPYLDKAIEQGPEEPFPYNNKASCLYHLGKYNEALRFVEKSLELDDTNSWAYANRAKILFALNMSQNACADVQKAKQLEYPEKADLAELSKQCEK